jgi:hypothetical protein
MWLAAKGKRMKESTMYQICDVIYGRPYKQPDKDVHLEDMFDVDDVLTTSGVSNAIDKTDSILFENFQILFVISLKNNQSIFQVYFAKS